MDLLSQEINDKFDKGQGGKISQKKQWICEICQTFWVADKQFLFLSIYAQAMSRTIYHLAIREVVEKFSCVSSNHLVYMNYVGLNYQVVDDVFAVVKSTFPHIPAGLFSFIKWRKRNGSNNLTESMTIACDSFPSSNALFHFKISVATIKFTARSILLTKS